MGRQKRLKKELGLFGVYAIATGTTLSAGFFLLPGIAATQAGPAIVLAYMIAAIPMIPAMFSIIELATAMPRAGGVYYYLDRTLGPALGTVGGIGTWLALILKVSFALVGMGAYISLFFPNVPITAFAIGLAFFLGLLNAFGAKKSGKLQIYLVVGLLIILIWFISSGIPELKIEHFNNFFGAGSDSIMATAGLVYISYVGITKIASLSEEVINPERNIPLGVILALTTSIIIYAVGTAVIVGVLPMDKLAGNLTPVSSAAEVFLGKTGSIVLAVAALLAFISVANAGTMSASRYPLAMSRDHIIPEIFRKLGKHGTPLFSIGVTVIMISAILVFLNPTKIAKLASAFQLMMFALACFAVIVMRESKIEAYDPGYKSPFYPWMQIAGVILPGYLIFEMGVMPSLFSLGLITAGLAWYFYYAKDKVVRQGAIYHVFERLGRQRFTGLDAELRGILKEKGLRKDDPFDQIIMRAGVIDIHESVSFEKAAELAAKKLSKIVPLSEEKIKEQFLEGTKIGVTPVTHGFALPHFRMDQITNSEMVLLRCKKGALIEVVDPLTQKFDEMQTVYAIFFLVSPEDRPTLHLRILAQIAGRVEESSFAEEWNGAKDEVELKEALLHDDRFLSICVRKGEPSEALIGKRLKDMKFPEGCLVALLRRGSDIIIPQGETTLQEGDRLSIIGNLEGMKILKDREKNRKL
ncbi:MAG: amino acid permease [Chlorobi bacterium]|nr:amino acid permease [Chlorobiota bacterium]